MNVGASVRRLLDIGGKKPLRVAFALEQRHRRRPAATLAPAVLLTPKRGPAAPSRCPQCGAPHR